ncbi:dephospho-CoA kinase/protein folding accessory domain-containing protein [Bacillus sp. THAF10]|uniref:GrpB family protein n=1 Tax=Bacillus sp. THAF10 TaxID=2587848 RepID=UPI00126823D1|nr:GrpB family protein [Bacillus sp. THAF10]QFT87663.1 dephospho-CoA kinase/protein folding accessory domain-containing protein [Bacillus sp. THAF10]
MRKTNIQPWTKEWEEAYDQEQELLKEILKDELIDIFHIGSTSVPAIGYAKPIIDILIVVKDIEKVDWYNEALQKMGYEPKGENGIAGRRYFPKGKQNRTHHVHIFEVGNETIQTHLDFKRYLMTHPEDAKEYGELKLKLAKQFLDNHYKNQEGKQEFVNELVERARSWGTNT